MLQLDISTDAESFILKKIKWHFWNKKPTLMLIEFSSTDAKTNELLELDKYKDKLIENDIGLEAYSTNLDKFSLSKSTSNLKGLLPVIKSRKYIPQSYENEIIDLKRFYLFPHIKMLLYRDEVKQWKLDLGKEGLVLLADDRLIAGIPK